MGKDTLQARVEESLRKRFRRTIWCNFTKAIKLYRLVREGDRIAVCISGSSGSMLMARLFRELKRHDEFPFELCFPVPDPGYAPDYLSQIEDNAAALGIPIRIISAGSPDTASSNGLFPRRLCTDTQSPILHALAKETGCNKIALEDLFDDVIETILTGMLCEGRIQTMMPRQKSTDPEGPELIRPMYLVREEAVRDWQDANRLRFAQSAATAEEGSGHPEIRALIAGLRANNPFVESNIFRSMENIDLRTVIAYNKDGVNHSFLDHYDRIP
ncbi:MAG: ATPase [Lachnospiraceae bacterium]|nr:ATPase [Lachnospiraceae bacterium]